MIRNAGRLEHGLYLIGTWSLLEDEAQTRVRAKWLKSIQPNPALFFHYQVDLSLIASAITNRVYDIHAPQEGWGQVERAINLYGQKMDRWLTTIHGQYTFLGESGELLRSFSSREQIGLALYFFSTRILLYRPCLSRPGIKEHSGIRFPRSRFGMILLYSASDLRFPFWMSFQMSPVNIGFTKCHHGGLHFIL